MVFKKLTLAALIPTLIWSTVQAKQGDDEDSVHEWGQWALPVTTAAGPEVTFNPLIFAGGPGEEHVFFDPDLTVPVEEGCQPGEFCGYASYYSFLRQYTPVERRFRGDGGEGRPRKPRYSKEDFSLIPVSASFFASEVSGDGGEGLQFNVAPGGDPSLYNDIESLLLDHSYFPYLAYGHTAEDDRFDGLTFFTLSPYSGIRRREGSLTHGYWLSLRLDEELPEFDGAEGRRSPRKVRHAFNVINRLTGQNETITAYVGSYVFGQTSTLDDLANLQSFLGEFNGLGGDLIASYRGHTAMAAPVHLSINFTDNTWGGSFNYGYDGKVSVYNSENGTSVMGKVGFNVAGGTISGINLNADSSALSAYDGQVEGSVTASFFGEGAQQVGGVADIVKTIGVPEVEESPVPQIQPLSVPRGKIYEQGVHVTTFSASLNEKGNID